ncbi:putative cytochrome P450 alkane hydroxylase [Melanomma pulvis-pyrius CBS 109.77]|uniref:Putative cytochrome P450 alkane hydroxylase n=1 Tax=Melanomma pulvis-pyrius CBS 109.77 TaxID=1314802 RepID=A0A6A6X7W6_9PLEO|nr:putative cytochrome P450 alkane hydroxylase [Melanomma pulvis-pyrius CBS 109.77]
MSTLGAITAALAFISIIQFVYVRIQHRIALAEASRSQNCATPPHLPTKDFLFGLDTVFENLRALKRNGRIKQISSQHQELGKTFESYPFGRRVVSTVDVRNIQAVLSGQQEKFGVGPIREHAQGPMTGRGIITSDGGVWMHGRDMVKPTFSRSQIADRGLFEGFVQRFLQLLPIDEGRIVDLQPLFDRLILDASSEFIFGESFDSLSSDCPVDSKRFLDAFSYAQKGVGLRVLMGKMSFLIRDAKFWEACKVIRQFTQDHVDRALSNRVRHNEREDTEKNIASHVKTRMEKGNEKYILVHEMARESQNREELCSQLLNVFFAGRDTPAVALSNIFFCLARHPKAWEKIRKEVEGLKIEDLTFERLKSLRYVQYVINEALRLYPPVPNQSRTALTPSILPTGGGSTGTQPILLFLGDTVSMNFYTMHRNSAIYSPDPNAFRPERWRDIRPGWHYLPFGGGARHCPAQQLALFWVAYTVVRMAMEVKGVRNRDEVEEFVECLKLNMESGNGVQVELVRG